MLHRDVRRGVGKPFDEARKVWHPAVRYQSCCKRVREAIGEQGHLVGRRQAPEQTDKDHLKRAGRAPDDVFLRSFTE